MPCASLPISKAKGLTDAFAKVAGGESLQISEDIALQMSFQVHTSAAMQLDVTLTGHLSNRQDRTRPAALLLHMLSLSILPGASVTVVLLNKEHPSKHSSTRVLSCWGRVAVDESLQGTFG